MRQDYEAFRARQTEILAIGPDGPRAFRRYWQTESLPFPGLADPRHVVANKYGQQVKWLKMGRMPALFIVDKRGQIRHLHYGESMSDIPASDAVLALLDALNAETGVLTDGAVTDDTHSPAKSAAER